MLVNIKLVDSDNNPINDYFLHIIYEFDTKKRPVHIYPFYIKNGDLYYHNNHNKKCSLYTNRYYLYISPFLMDKSDIYKNNCTKRININKINQIIKINKKCNFIRPLKRGIDLYRNFGWNYINNNGIRMHHRGDDYECNAGEKVLAFLDGKIYLADQIAGFGTWNQIHKRFDPGGAVVIEHKNRDNENFYALYGHLNIESTINIGDNINKGALIGTILDYNNGYSDVPHLHFGIYAAQIFPKIDLGYGKDLIGWIDPELYMKQKCWID
jgi:murein DD-endopeptidase MepM/ murein hydrolase activator NlpD